MISVIIPTMWFHQETLKHIVDDLTKQNCIEEIIIFSNNKFQQNWDLLNLQKVIKIEPSKNLGCNPSWNAGAIIAKNDKLFILNDDFHFDFSICEKIEPHITEQIGMIGANPDSNTSDGPLRLVPSTWPNPLPGGFACGFFIHRNVFLEKIIPHELKLHCGDNWLLDTTGRQHYCISGINFPKTFSGTIPAVRQLDSSHPLYIDSLNDERRYAELVQRHINYTKQYHSKSIIL